MWNVELPYFGQQSEGQLEMCGGSVWWLWWGGWRGLGAAIVGRSQWKQVEAHCRCRGGACGATVGGCNATTGVKEGFVQVRCIMVWCGVDVEPL